MSTILQMIENAGSRAEAISGFPREVFGEVENVVSGLEARLAALEAKIAAIGDLNSYVPRASTSAAAAEAVSAKLKSVAKAAAASLERALLDETAAPVEPGGEAARPAPSEPPAKS